jgi:hypothetical protein
MREGERERELYSSLLLGSEIPQRFETLSLSLRPNALTKELSTAQWRRRSETAKSNRIRIKITDYSPPLAVL